MWIRLLAVAIVTAAAAPTAAQEAALCSASITVSERPEGEAPAG